MSKKALAVVPPKDKVKSVKKRHFKPRIMKIELRDIVDVWRLYTQFDREIGMSYPDLSEYSPSEIRHFLWNYIDSVRFRGLLVKKGRKPVGMILAQLQDRPIGKPHKYAFVWVLWIDPEFRKDGIAKQLCDAFFQQMKQEGVHYWESYSTDDFTQFLLNYGKVPAKKFMNILGGKIDHIGGS